MIIIGNKIISDDIVHQKFVCDLNACKGACCVEGDYGAPLEFDELPILDKIYEKVKPFLTDKGIQAIENQGKYVQVSEPDKYATTLIDNQPCAYYYQDKGISYCGIEKAWMEGIIDFRKPISCQLYPIRVEKAPNDMEILNYDQWDICGAACANGRKKDVRVYQFLKEPLIRKYGLDFYDELEAAADHLLGDE